MMVLNDDGRFVYHRQKNIEITKNSVSFEGNVYQLCNITGFSAGRVNRRPVVPCWWIIVGFIVGAILININIPVSYFKFSNQYVRYGTLHIGAGIIILSMIGIFINIAQETRYGLILTLNSGDKHLFITINYGDLSELVKRLHAFIESKQEGVYIINMTDNSIKIKGNMTGVAATGTRNTTISSNTNHSGDKK